MFINELQKNEQNKLINEVQTQVNYSVKAICTIAEKYKVNKKELFDLFVYLCEQFIKKRDINKCRGFDIEKAMELLKKLLKSR